MKMVKLTAAQNPATGLEKKSTVKNKFRFILIAFHEMSVVIRLYVLIGQCFKDSHGFFVIGIVRCMMHDL